MITINEYIDDAAWLGEREYITFANWTALRYRDDLGFFYKNLERGPLLFHLIDVTGASRILEFGTGRGYGALCCALALRQLGRQGQVTSIDINDADSPGRVAVLRTDCEPELIEASINDLMKQADSSLAEGIRLVVGDSQAVASELLQAGQRFDLIYIDGDHSYVGAFFDLVAAVRLAVTKATIVFDDYGMDGVRKVVDGVRSDFPESVDIVHTEGCLDAFRYGTYTPPSTQAMAVLHVEDREALLKSLGPKRLLRRAYAQGGAIRKGGSLLRRSRLGSYIRAKLP